MVSDQEIAEGVETVLRQQGPNNVTSVNGVVQQLEAKLGLDLSHKAAFIRDQISFLLRPYPLHHHQQQQQQPQPPPPKDHFALHHNPYHHHPQFAPTPFLPQQFPSHFALHPHSRPPPEAYTFQAQQPPQQQLRRPVALPQQPPPKFEVLASQNATAVAPEPPKDSAPTTGTKRRGGAGGLNKVCGVSPELQVVVGEPALPRTEIVKQLWAYIRKNNLQDPSNKRKIICDDALRVVFETDCTDMFKMNKLLSKHIITLGPKKEPTQAKRVKLDAESATDTDNTQPGSSTVTISEALAKFLGLEGREMLKSEAIRLVWEYVKANNLEDPVNSMVIVCDPKLHELLGCESISALGVQEMLDRYHFIKQS
ncbi:putative transcription regulator SWI/SNF-BAF60b family [Rosa chinensis]|uniref:Putative transcription regulator SWI/SNF-BAF60b family n=1 Tax=Rosa chinensis TaxID=74649 RepID=A0A2P6Q2D2_ROSCH|nr:uncharacterized protein LOC112166101 [Rosa chinensis]PRQ28289.1 putative transcription regulator SWI/SNF-BAF60b family [Rosa chinensis]